MRQRLLLLALLMFVLPSCRLLIDLDFRKVPRPEPRAVNTYYVGQSGTGNCTTARNNSAAGSRVSTIAAGIACLASGDTLVIGAGVYNEKIAPDTIPSGSGPGGEGYEASWPGATIIRAENSCTGLTTLTPTCSTVLRPTSCGDNGSSVVWVYSTSTRSYIVFQGFEADANSVCQTGFRMASQIAGVSAAHHIRLQQIYVHDATGSHGGGGIIGAFGANPCSAASPCQEYGHHMEVLDSVVKRLNMGGVDLPPVVPAGGIHCFYFNTSGTIRRNRIDSCSPTDHNGQCIGTHSASNLVVDISGNEISNCGFQGIEAGVTVGAKVYNNVVYDVGFPACDTSPETAWSCGGISIHGTDTHVYNNTVYNVFGAASKGISMPAPGYFGTSGTIIRNNIVYGAGDGIDFNEAAGPATVDHNRCASGCETNADPQFVNAAGRNFHLNAGSPMIGIGANLASHFLIDKDGAARPGSGSWTLGAYEGITTPFVPSFPIATDFPSVACCLDSFNRANGAIGASYLLTSGTAFTIAGNQAAADPGWGRMLYTGATFTPGHEVYALMPSLTPTGGTSILVFAATEASDVNQYRIWLQRYAGGNASLQAGRIDNLGNWNDVSAEIDLGTDVSGGQSYGVRVTSAKVLTVYWQYNGTWYRVIGPLTDSNLPSAGTMRVGFAGWAPMTLDNLGGGSCCTEAPVGPGNIGRFGTLFPKQ